MCKALAEIYPESEWVMILETMPAAGFAQVVTGISAQETAQGRLLLPDGWSTRLSRSTGERYYFNEITGESTYDYPHEPAVQKETLMTRVRRAFSRH